MDRGYIKTWRKIQDWEWYKDQNTYHLFNYLIMNASYKDSRFQGEEVKRGQVVFGRKQASSDTGISEQSIRTSLTKLKSTNEITIKPTNRFSLITISNYDSYQSNEEKINQHINQQANQQLTSDQPATNHIQEVKKVISKEVNPLVGEFLDYFNLKAKKNLTLNDSRKAIIESRLKVYTINQLKQAVDNFVKDDWDGRNKFMDVVYCIGVRNKVDNLERWLNQKPKTNWIKP